MQRQPASSGRPRSAPSIARSVSKFLLSVSPLLAFTACSTTPSEPPTPVLEANLAADCPPLPPPPSPLLDPERSIWEEILIAAYGECAGRHHRTVKAWPTDKSE